MLWWTLRQLKSKYSWTRQDAARELGKSRNVKAVEPLIVALKDSDLFVRREAAEALGKIGDGRAVEPLIVALKDKDSDVRKYAVESLVKIGKPAVEPLIKALKDEDSDVRKKVAEALREIGDVRAVEPLIVALKDSDLFVRSEAAEALGKIGDGRAVAPLIVALKDDDWYVRKNVASALSKIRTPEANQAALEFKKQNAECLAEEASKEAKEWRLMTMSDQEMVNKLAELARYYANGGYSKDNPSLVNLVKDIGRKLNRRGGIREMRRIFNQMPPMQGKRTVEMDWDGIGDWRG